MSDKNNKLPDIPYEFWCPSADGYRFDAMRCAEELMATLRRAPGHSVPPRGAVPVSILPGNVLHCPDCNGECLHQESVEAGFRRHEDGPESAVATSTHFQILIARKAIKGRRDQTRIRFWCEHCPSRPTLTITQHKGSTYVEWDESGPE
jgi:hypothetical protein